MDHPFVIHQDAAPSYSYNRAEHGLDATSRQLITKEQFPGAALNIATLEPPIDYSAKLAQDILVYQLEGKAKFSMAGREYDVSPGTVLYVPANMEHQHKSSEKNTFIVVWVPAPDPAARAH